VLIVLLLPLWAVLSGNVEVVRQMLDMMSHDQSTLTLVLAAPAALLGLAGLTWLQMVGGMCLSLTGRPALVNGFALAALAVVGLIAGLGIYAGLAPDFFETALVVLWCLGGTLGLAKFGLVCWTWSQPGWRDKTLPWLVLVWLTVAACLLGPLYALVPANPVPTNLIALFVVLALPLARLTALPWAVAWNRHR
jgi:hypothetical protein